MNDSHDQSWETGLNQIEKDAVRQYYSKINNHLRRNHLRKVERNRLGLVTASICIDTDSHPRVWSYKIELALRRMFEEEGWWIVWIWKWGKDDEDFDLCVVLV